MEDKRSRLYGEKEISALLKRAAEIQDEKGVTVTTGLSLAEVQQLAAEVGIDPQHIEAALAEMDRREEAPQKANIWGGPVSYSQERVIEGDVTEEMWESMVAEIRRAFKDTGEVHQWGQSLEWTHSGKSGDQANVTITPRDGRTKVRIFANYPTLAAGIYAGIMPLGLVLGIISAGLLQVAPLFKIFALVSLFSMAFVVCRSMLVHFTKKREKSIKQLVRRLEQIIQEQAPQGGAQLKEKAAALPETTGGQLEIEEQEEQPESATIRSRTRASSGPS